LNNGRKESGLKVPRALKAENSEQALEERAMDEKIKGKKRDNLLEWLRWQGIGLGLKILAFLMRWRGKKDEWLARALRELEGVYRFESGDKKFCRYFILKKGRVFVEKSWSEKPDFTLTLYEPSKLRFRARQMMILEIIFGNKIGQSGNLFYIYQFGFIMSLLERSFRKKKLAGV